MNARDRLGLGRGTGQNRRAFLGKTLALGASAGLVGGAATACSSDDGGFEQSPSASSPTSASATPTGPQQYTATINVATLANPPKEAQQALTAAYQKHQPNVTLEWDTKDFGGSGNYTSYLGTQLAAGDIKLDIVSGNYVKSFDHYVDLDRYQEAVNPYTGNPWNKDLNFDFYRSANAKGQRNMVATESVHTQWYYNKDLFEKAGASVPTTWDEFVETCAKLKAKGITPVVANYQWQIPAWLSEYYWDQYYIDWVKTVRAQDGDWDFNPDLDGKFVYEPELPNIHNTYTLNMQRFYKGIKDGTLKFDTPSTAELAKQLGRVFPKYATPDIWVITDPYPTFLQQNAAMMINTGASLIALTNDLAKLSPDRLKELKLKPGDVKRFEWGTFNVVPMQGDLVQSKHVRCSESSSGIYASTIDKNADQTAAVMDFLMFWLSKAGFQPFLDAYVKSGQWAPSGKLQISGLDEPDADKIFDDVKLQGNAGVPQNQFYTLGTGATQQKDLAGLLKSSLTGDISTTTYATKLQSYIDDHFAESLKAASLTEADLADPARRPASS